MSATTSALTEEQILNLGFIHREKIRETESDYEYWELDILGEWFLDVTNEYAKDGTLTKQYYTINSFTIDETNQKEFLQLVKALKDLNKIF